MANGIINAIILNIIPINLIPVIADAIIDVNIKIHSNTINLESDTKNLLKYKLMSIFTIFHLTIKTSLFTESCFAKSYFSLI